MLVSTVPPSLPSPPLSVFIFIHDHPSASRLSQVAPFREEGMGWGLKLAEDLPKGSLVGEYVGEVRAWAEKQRTTNATLRSV